MPALKDNVASTSGTNVSSLTLSSFTIASNSDRMLILLSGMGDAAGAQTHANWSWNGSTSGFVESYDASQNGGFHSIGMAYLLNPTATTANASVDYSGGGGAPCDEAFLAALSYYNVHQTTPHSTVRNVAAPASGKAWVSCDGYTDGISIGFFWGNGSAAAVTDSIPDYIAVGSAVQSAGATSLNPTSAPAGMQLGDWEYASVATENNETISVSGTGWVQIGSTVQQDSTWQVALFARLYDGSNVNPTFSWSSSVGCSARRWSIRDQKNTSAIGSHTTNSGNTSTHSITGQNATANNSLFMYLSHAEANTALGADADYSERFDAGSATGPYRLVVGDRDQATSGAGSANFSATGANASWVMRLVECLAGNTQTQETEIENIAGFDTGAIASETGQTYNQFGWTITGINGNGGMIAFGLNPAAAAADQFLPPLVMAAPVATGYAR